MRMPQIRTVGARGGLPDLLPIRVDVRMFTDDPASGHLQPYPPAGQRALVLYSKSHEWVAFSGETAKVGLTDFAQNALGGLVFVNLPEVGDEVGLTSSSDLPCGI